MSALLRATLALALALASSACATGSGGGGGNDGGTSGADGSTTRHDGGSTQHDGGSGVCASDQHRCGGGCIDDLPNEPENGCQFGCGEPCPTPPDGAAACGTDGLCTFSCPAPFHQEGTECVCTPQTCDDIGYTCGAPDDGCGTPLDCGACDGDGVCTDGTCACPEDDQEPNDSKLAAETHPVLAMMTDSPDTDLTFSAFTTDAADDVDWYRFHIDDGSDGGAPVISVTLRGFPTGSDYQLSAFWTCDSGTPGEGCNAGATDTEVGYGCTANTAGDPATVTIDSWCGHTLSGDPGVLYVRVTPMRWSNSCDAYTLDVSAH